MMSSPVPLTTTGFKRGFSGMSKIDLTIGCLLGADMKEIRKLEQAYTRTHAAKHQAAATKRVFKRFEQQTPPTNNANDSGNGSFSIC